MVTGSRASSLQGQYVFGDFVSGRLWALSLPDIAEPVPAVSLGTWPLLLSTFGLDAAGDLYVVDFGRGAVYAMADPGWTTDQAVSMASAVGSGACTACHGAAGEGSEAMKAPPLAGLQDWYITSQLAAFAAGEREEDAAVMTASVAVLPDAAAHRDVAAYILTLGR